MKEDTSRRSFGAGLVDKLLGKKDLAATDFPTIETTLIVRRPSERDFGPSSGSMGCGCGYRKRVAAVKLDGVGDEASADPD